MTALGGSLSTVRENLYSKPARAGLPLPNLKRQFYLSSKVAPRESFDSLTLQQIAIVFSNEKTILAVLVVSIIGFVAASVFAFAK